VGSLLALLALLLFSLSVFVVRAASARIGLQVGFLVAMGANVAFGLLLFVGDWLIRGTALRIDGQALALFALAGVFATYLGRLGFFRSVATLGPSRASAIQITNPVFAAALAWLLLGEAIDAPTAAFIALVTVGLYLNTRTTPSSGPFPPPGNAPPRKGGVPITLVWPAILAAAAYAVGNILRAHAIDAWSEPILGGLVGALAALVAYAVLHVRLNQLRMVWDAARDGTRGVFLWALAGFLTISAQVSVIAAMASSPVAIVLVISSALPIVVVPVNLLVLRNVEQLRASTVVGSMLVMVGVTGILLR